jgi:hypothetical protein
LDKWLVTTHHKAEQVYEKNYHYYPTKELYQKLDALKHLAQLEQECVIDDLDMLVLGATKDGTINSYGFTMLR